MTKIACGQTTIPEVDNTALPCDKYISEDCIIIAEAIPYIGSMNNSSLKDVLEKLVEKLKTQARLINNLQNQINNG